MTPPMKQTASLMALVIMEDVTLVAGCLARKTVQSGVLGAAALLRRRMMQRAIALVGLKNVSELLLWPMTSRGWSFF